VNRPSKAFSGTLVIAAALGVASVVYAADDATMNQCWGETTQQFAQVDDGQPGIGEHSSNPPGIDPGEGREGVGNVSKEDHAPLSEGGQGDHANAVGEQMGLEECDGPDVP
jgi:hypothetical protein